MSSVPKPGMITLRNKKTNELSYHFPVDVKEIAVTSKGKYEIVEDGSIESARVVSAPLRQALIQAAADDNVVAVVQNGPDGVFLVTEDQVKPVTWSYRNGSGLGPHPSCSNCFFVGVLSMFSLRFSMRAIS